MTNDDIVTPMDDVDKAKQRPAKTHVLVVDDHPAICAVVTDILDMDGYEVLTAVNGLEALSIFADNRERIGVVLLDSQMPVMDGEETLSRLLPMAPNIAVIFSSGHIEESVERWQSTGRENQITFLPKPYDAIRLLEAVERAMKWVNDAG